jgi:hypothetical protein
LRRVNDGVNIQFFRAKKHVFGDMFDDIVPKRAIEKEGFMSAVIEAGQTPNQTQFGKSTGTTVEDDKSIAQVNQFLGAVNIVIKLKNLISPVVGRTAFKKGHFGILKNRGNGLTIGFFGSQGRGQHDAGSPAVDDDIAILGQKFGGRTGSFKELVAGIALRIAEKSDIFNHG